VLCALLSVFTHVVAICASDDKLLSNFKLRRRIYAPLVPFHSCFVKTLLAVTIFGDEINLELVVMCRAIAESKHALHTRPRKKKVFSVRMHEMSQQSIHHKLRSR
jgi:hypothetical protein